MKRVTKFNGKLYEVKPTGNRQKSKAKSYTDFNGYEVDKPSSSNAQLGLYIADELYFTLGRNGTSIFSGSHKYGDVTVRDIKPEELDLL